MRYYFSYFVLFSMVFGTLQVSAITYAQYIQILLFFQASVTADGCGGFSRRIDCFKETQHRWVRNGQNCPWREVPITKESEQDREACAEDFKMHLSTLSLPEIICSKNCNGESKNEQMIGAACDCICFYDTKSQKTTSCKAILHSGIDGINCCDGLNVHYMPENMEVRDSRNKYRKADNEPKHNKYDLSTKKKMNDPKKGGAKKIAYKTVGNR